jgi:hypothetical protein
MSRLGKLTVFLHRHTAIILFIAVFLVYVLLNVGFTGPVFLDDELGYLNKAAVMAGYPKDVSSSYFAGYSLVLVPIFWLFSEAQTIWHAVVILNAAFMTGSLVVLWRVLKRLFPKKDNRTLLTAVIVAALYPSWSAIVGYAFVTPFFVFVFMLALWSSLNVNYDRMVTLVLPSFLFGYLCWIHPIGVAVGLAWIITLFILFRLRNFSNLLLTIAIIAGMFVVYKFGLHAWLHNIMNVSKSLSDDHYDQAAADISAVVNPKFILKFTFMVAGQLGAALVTTFGLAVFVWARAGTVLTRQLRHPKPIKSIGVRELSLFLMLAMVLIAAFGSLNFYLAQLTTHQLELGHRFDFWIYGRYMDMVLLPVIGLGFLQKWHRSYIIFAAISVFLLGLIFAVAHIGHGATFNYINVVAFWPQYVYQGTPNFFIWMSIGAGGVLYLAFIRKYQLLLFLLPLFVLSTYTQSQTHTNHLTPSYNNPPGLLKVVRDNLAKGSCIGYEGVPRSGDSRTSEEDLYRFYFYDYHYIQMTAAAWLTDNSCDYYLARTPAPFEVGKTTQAMIVGRENSTPIYLVAKKQAAKRIKTSDAEARNFYLNASPLGGRCAVQGCFDFTADELQWDTRAGRLANHTLDTHGAAGFLLFGPYRFLDAGSYKLVMKAAVKKSDGAKVQIINGDSPEEATYFKEVTLEPNSNNTVEIPFTLVRKKIALQIRVVVSEGSDIRFEHYEIRDY